MVNEWTSNDVPSVSSLGLYNKRPDLDISGMQFGAVVAFGAMVKHLNAHYPKPENQEQLLRMCNEADLKRTRAEADADRWRRAHEIVEGERDLARERLREVETALAKCMSDYQDVDVEDERDEAGREVSTWRSSTESAHSDFLQAAHDRDEWRARAEAAEARTAVTRDEVEQAIRGKVWAANREPNKAGFHRVHVDWATDAIHALVAGDDPAVLVVRESEVAAVEVVQGGNWRAGTTGIPLKWTAQKVREMRDDYASEWVECEAIARAIEAEPADPVQQKAAGWAAAVGIDWGHAEPEDVDLLMKVAAHVLGQEAGDE